MGGGRVGNLASGCLPLRAFQVLSQGLWLLCAEMGVAWRILGVGDVSDPYLSV